MKVLILAAGYGTRLYPYTKNFPKPLLKVRHKPIINYLLDKVKEVDGISKIIVVTNDRFFGLFSRWKKKTRIAKQIRIINDLSRSPEDKLGAIKDMELAFRKEGYRGDFLVLGGDNFFQQPLGQFVRSAKEHSPGITIGAFDLKKKRKAVHYGVLRIGPSGRVIDFEEKPRSPRSTMVAMCLYYFPQSKLQLVKKYLADPKNFHDAIGAYIKWLVKRKAVYGFIFRRVWFDIGHIHTYNRLKAVMQRKEK